MTLKLGGVNGHNEPGMTEYVKGLMAVRFDAVACFESQDQRGRLAAIHRTRMLEPGGEFNNRARATSIVTRDSNNRVGTLVRQVSEKIERFERVAPDRVLLCEMFEHPITRGIKGVEGVAFFGLHPDAGPEALAGRDPDHPIVREYNEALTSAAVHMHAAVDDGLLVVLAGDLQVGLSNNRPWSPTRVLAEPLNLTVINRNIDWMLVDSRLEVKNVAFTEMFDHWAIAATMEAM